MTTRRVQCNDHSASRDSGRPPLDLYAEGMRRPLTVNVDEHVLDALRAAARRDGVPEEELVDEALRRWFGLRGIAVLDDIADRQASRHEAVDEDESMSIALQEVRAARHERRARDA